MANAAKDYGLIPIRSLTGGGLPPAIRCVALSGYGTNLFIGDPVILAGSGDTSGRPSVNIAIGSEGSESTGIFGVITGFTPQNPDSLNVNYGAASTTRILTVIPALPTVVFRVNASNTTGPNPNDIGYGFDLVLGSGDTLTGKSGWALDVGEDNQAGATSGQCRLIGFSNRADNAIGAAATDTPNIDCEVVIIESYWNTAPTEGVN